MTLCNGIGEGAGDPLDPYPRSTFVTRVQHVVRILYGISELGAHVGSNICYSICLKHLIKSRAVSCYLQIKVPLWNYSMPSFLLMIQPIRHTTVINLGSEISCRANSWRTTICSATSPWPGCTGAGRNVR